MLERRLRLRLDRLLAMARNLSAPVVRKVAPLHTFTAGKAVKRASAPLRVERVVRGRTRTPRP
ncbi:DUF6457 domain-containing protein [Streptomyces afghaniensis]|uniref:DUF6457 domain-containing protein n=1 Tax=Streptomyces afghaniensis TaxID=66865 RepID=UPI0033A4DFA2